MDSEYDYESMAKEYAKITPVTLQSSTFSNGDAPELLAVKPLVKLYNIYIQISNNIKMIMNTSSNTDLFLLLTNFTSRIINNISTLLTENYLPEKTQATNVNGYTNTIRNCLKLSAEGVCSALCYKQQIPYLTYRLCFDEINIVHMLLLTLTAF